MRGQWELVAVNDSADRDNPFWTGKAPKWVDDDVTFVMLRRTTPRRGGKSPKVDLMSITIEADGHTVLRRNHCVQSVKAHRRAKAHAFACQAAAYYALMGSIDGFPPIDLFSD